MSGEYVRIPSLEYASVSAGCFDANITSFVAYYSRSANWTAMIEPLTVPNECQTTDHPEHPLRQTLLVVIQFSGSKLKP